MLKSFEVSFQLQLVRAATLGMAGYSLQDKNHNSIHDIKLGYHEKMSNIFLLIEHFNCV